jgi:hypothetical protein
MLKNSVNSALAAMAASNPSPDGLATDFETCFGELESTGSFHCLPRSADSIPTIDRPAWHRALVDRLQLLGYDVVFRPVSSRFQAVLAGAPPDNVDVVVKVFQGDAGLLPDAWVGAQTWRAMQQLFTFETPFVPDAWFLDGHPREALKRGVSLRLATYGFAGRPGAGSGVVNHQVDPALHARLAAFAPVAIALGLIPAGPTPALNPSLATLILNHDALVAAIVTNLRPDLSTYGTAVDAVRAFLLAVLKVELWLGGSPGLLPDADVALTETDFEWRHFAREKKLTKFGQALSDFAVEAGLSRTALNLADWQTSFDAQLGPLIAHVCETGGPAGDADPAVVAAILEAQSRVDPGFWAKITGAMDGLANKLFDGLRRAWRWIKRVAGQTITWAGQALETLARGVWQHLSHIGRGIRTAFEAFVEGVKYCFSEIMPGSDPASVVTGHDRDFDFRQFVAVDGLENAVASQCQRLNRAAVAFRIACRILGLVIGMVRTCLLSGGGLTAFIAVPLGLLRAADGVGALIRELAQYRTLDYTNPDMAC